MIINIKIEKINKKFKKNWFFFKLLIVLTSFLIFETNIIYNKF